MVALKFFSMENLLIFVYLSNQSHTALISVNVCIQTEKQFYMVNSVLNRYGYLSYMELQIISLQYIRSLQVLCRCRNNGQRHWRCQP